jgi:hypothetical protein
MDPKTASLHDQLVSLIGGGAGSSIDLLSKLASGDQGTFQQLEAPAFRNFEQGMGQLGSRFAGMGMGATKGSGFKLASGGMAQDLATSLQSQRMNLQQQAISQLLGMSQSLMGTPTQGYGLVQKAPSFWESLLPGMGSSASSMGLMKLFGMF